MYICIFLFTVCCYYSLATLLMSTYNECFRRKKSATFLYFVEKNIYLDAPLYVCVEVLWPSQQNGVMLSTVNLPNNTFTG